MIFEVNFPASILACTIDICVDFKYHLRNEKLHILFTWLTFDTKSLKYYNMVESDKFLSFQ